MEQYIAIQVVEAEPMTRQEYAERRGWGVMSELDANTDLAETPGYRVVEADGFENWITGTMFESTYHLAGSNQLIDSALLMASDSAKERLLGEIVQADTRLTRLNEYIKAGISGLPVRVQALLHRQAEVMEEYHAILAERLVLLNEGDDKND